MWTGGLPHQSRLPHLPGFPHLHVNRPLVALQVSFRVSGLTSIVERHISERFCATLWCSVNGYSGISRSEDWNLNETEVNIQE